MSSLAVETPRAFSVNCTEHELIVFLADGRSISVPIAWFPRLANANAQQRAVYEILGDGEGIHWPQIDEDISVFGLIAGKPSVEFQETILNPFRK